MPQVLPIVPSIPGYRERVPLPDAGRLFDFRWNDRDQAWYMDILSEDEVSVRMGVKVVIGPLGQSRAANELGAVVNFGILVAIDTSGEERDPTFEDLGARIKVLWFSPAEVGALT